MAPSQGFVGQRLAAHPPGGHHGRGPQGRVPSGLQNPVRLQPVLCAGTDRHAQRRGRDQRAQPQPGTARQRAGGSQRHRSGPRGHDQDAHEPRPARRNRLAQHLGRRIGAPEPTGYHGTAVSSRQWALHPPHPAGAGRAHRAGPTRRHPRARAGREAVADHGGRDGRGGNRHQDGRHQRSGRPREHRPDEPAQPGARDHHQAGLARGLGLPLCLRAVRTGRQCQPSGHDAAGGAHSAATPCRKDGRARFG